jgi:hypothetical protein
MNDLETRVRSEKTKFAFKFFHTPEGMLVMENLEKAFGFSAPAFVPGENGTFDPIRAAIRDGQRQVLLHIKSMSDKSNEQENTTKPTVSKD